MGALRHDVNMGRFSSAGGRLLVAQPTMVDPNFHRTVVFVIDHGEDGAFGVVLNRPTATPVVAVLAEYAPIVAEPEVFFDGGPVGPDNVVGLGPDPVSVGRLVDLGSLVDVMNGTDGSDGTDAQFPSQLRLFAGYAGWAPHQLDVEVAEGSWLVLDATSEDLFGPRPALLWETVLHRQGGPISRIALYPDDVSLN